MKIALLLAIGAFSTASLASAETNAAVTKPAAPVTKPKAGQGNAPALKTAAPAQPKGRLATHTTAAGKKITYDCSKKGNANKKACKA